MRSAVFMGDLSVEILDVWIREDAISCIFQVIIGSAELKANQSIRQIIEIVTDVEKYTRCFMVTLKEK